MQAVQDTSPRLGRYQLLKEHSAKVAQCPLVRITRSMAQLSPIGLRLKIYSICCRPA
jgi:hypothetical protein